MEKSITKILGIAAFYHDAAAAIIIDGEIIAAAQEERFTRIKNTKEFPINAIQFCLTEANLTLDELDAVVFYDKPLLKFERLLQTYYTFAPKGIRSFLKSIPGWLEEKLFLKHTIHKSLASIETYNKSELHILFSEHHVSHAASAFYPSPFLNAAIITIDGVGEWATTTISQGNNTQLKMLKEVNYPHSVGLLYSAITYYLGFKINTGEYKVMGLSPYSKRDSHEVKRIFGIITSKLITIYDDGSVWLNQKYFSYNTTLRMLNENKWEQLFGFKRRNPSEAITQQHCDLAMAIQLVIEDVLLKLAHTAKELTNAENLCLAGGVALNCVANNVLRATKLFKNIYVQPAAGDAGGAIGAALALYYSQLGRTRSTNGYDAMKGSYLGPSFSNETIQLRLKDKIPSFHYVDDNNLVEEISKKLAEGKIIGWFQGRMEFGPRALGNRSILADATNPRSQERVNKNIKFRETFRPFAPAVLLEDVSLYFQSSEEAPYMTFTTQIHERLQRNKDMSYDTTRSLQERLAIIRSPFPAITHLDYSARVQTVNKTTNHLFWKLLKAHKDNTGHGMVLNTSFNVMNEPIVCTPEDAYTCFLSTQMDVLVLGNYIFEK